MDNYLPQTLKLTALVAAFLLLVSAFSEEFEIGGLTIKKMDLLADVRPDSIELKIGTSADSGQIATGLPRKRAENCPDSLICLEDYSPGGAALARFFQKIDSLKTGKRQVRVAFFGDSFVEGDILLADLRDTLQKRWGGRGVGFLPMSSPAGGIMRSISFSSGNGWILKDIVHDDKGPFFGISGHFFQPKTTASWTNFEAARFFPATGQWSRARVFYQKNDSLAIAVKINDGEKTVYSLPFGPEIRQFETNSPSMRSFAVSFGPTEGLSVFGCSLEDSRGFYIDNFSVRGNTGGRLKKVEKSVYRQFDKLLGYDLIVLQFGMNAVTNSLKNIGWYESELDGAVNYMKEAFPGRPILLIGCPDRGGKRGGEIHTMEAVPHIVAMQRRLAEKHGLLFYDLFEAMGGTDAVIRLAEHKPIFAYKDYTHLTHEGGRLIGLRMARALFEEQKKYQPTPQ